MLMQPSARTINKFLLDKIGLNEQIFLIAKPVSVLPGSAKRVSIELNQKSARPHLPEQIL